MSAPDFVARAIAARAIAASDTLNGPDGAAQVGYTADAAQSILRPVADRLASMGLTPEDFGALGDGSHTDGAPLAAFADAVAAMGEGIVRLGNRTYAVGHDAPGDPFSWSGSGGGMIGRGMDRTAIANVNPAGGRAFEFGGSCRDLYFADMTFHGGFGSGAANDLERIVFNRCRFTTRPDAFANALKLVTDNMAGGVQAIYFIDCEFIGAGRMNFELQNHANDGVCRYSGIHFVRPRVIGAGRHSPAVGMGLSFSGKGDHVTLDAPYFDGNAGPQLENAGCDRLVVRDAAIRAATAPVDIPAISFSGRSMAHNANSQCVIDGLRLVRAAGDPPGLPVLRSEMSFTASERLTLRNLCVATASEDGSNGRSVLSFSGTGNDDDGLLNRCGPVTIENCDLASDAFNKPVIAMNTMRGQNRINGNVLTNTNPGRAGPLVAAYATTGAQSYSVQVSGNRMEAAVPHGDAPFAFRNNAARINVSDDNPGMPTRVTATTTVPAGSLSGPLVPHGLPNRGLKVRAQPLGRTSGGGVPYGSLHISATQMRANLDQAASADVEVELEITSEP
ncbi:hypothetical protein [Altererythrobacter sp. MTPC7]|uniref:hypothetical protein n=1 Tax=Altererythrobacter sp. MTPC7 TaxID=3056567 RepID=UPI0036F1F730